MNNLNTRELTKGFFPIALVGAERSTLEVPERGFLFHNPYLGIEIGNYPRVSTRIQGIPEMFDLLKQSENLTSSQLDKNRTRTISLKEARRKAIEILHKAEEERRRIALEETKRDIAWELIQ